MSTLGTHDPPRTERVAILQSNYIPWKGVFDMIARVDRFVFHDDLQYTKGDWRNRNRIKTPQGTQWLTIPCGSSEKRLICEVELRDSRWQRQHFDRLRQNYARTPHFERYRPWLEDVYLGTTWTNLSELNQTLTRRIATELLGFDHVTFDDSRRFGLTSHKAERVIDLLEAAGASHYLSGPAARDYLDESAFAARGIALEWMDYDGYPEYEQPHPPFDHAVTVLDLLFCVGNSAMDHLRRGARSRA